MKGKPIGFDHRVSASESGTTDYAVVHQWIRRHFLRTGRCEYCGATDRRTEYAAVGGRYTRNRADWFEVCKRCHMALDGPASAETRAKMSAVLRGNTRAKGKIYPPRTAEHRAHISVARRAYFARRRAEP